MKRSFFTRAAWICLGCITILLLTAASGPSGFSARALLPENQIDPMHSYFDLHIPPQTTQTVQLEVTSSEKQSIIAHVSLIPASTGRNGMILYNNPEARDESMTVSITDIASVPEPDVEILPGETALIDVDIALPQQPLDGVVLGGLVVTAEYAGDPPTPAAEEADRVQIHNQFTFVLGLKITQTSQMPEPDFKLLGITPDSSNYHPVLRVHLQNPQATIIKDMIVEAQISRSGDKQPMMELQLLDAEMAPQSAGDFVMEWPDGIVEPGKYRLNLLLEHQGRQWRWEEYFTIAKEEAEQINREALSENAAPAPQTLPWKLISLILLLLLFLLMLSFFWVLRRRRRR